MRKLHVVGESVRVGWEIVEDRTRVLPPGRIDFTLSVPRPDAPVKLEVGRVKNLSATGPCARSECVNDSFVILDWDRDGRLLSVEMLAPPEGDDAEALSEYLAKEPDSFVRIACITLALKWRYLAIILRMLPEPTAQPGIVGPSLVAARLREHVPDREAWERLIPCGT
jgi:hypothetical protein